MTTATMEEKKTKKEEAVRKCEDCGKEMHGYRENYHYTECGLQSVMLKNILVFHCDCGAISARIPAIAWLHRAIVFDLIQKKTLLSAEEIKFLRKMAGLNGVELADALGVHKTTLSKWENGKRTITKNSDGALRLLCFVGMLQELVQQKDLLPQFKQAIKQLTSMEITRILQAIKDVLEGPKNIKLDPEELPLLGYPQESSARIPAVQ